MQVECLDFLPRCVLGESPWWDVATARLLWVDIVGGMIRRFDPLTLGVEEIATGTMTGFAVAGGNETVVAGLMDGIYRMKFGTPGRARVAALPDVLACNRFNDGKCDRAGRLWAGTMNLSPDFGASATGSLYRYLGGLLEEVAGDIHISNGIGWSPDNRVMYYTDTLRREISCFDYDIRRGQASNRRCFLTVPESDGYPDGLTVDSRGKVYSAMWGAGRINVYTPAGRLECVLPLPVPQPSSCTFGGGDLKSLFITTASEGLSARELASAPLSGHLLRIKMDVPGLPETPFLQDSEGGHADLR